MHATCTEAPLRLPGNSSRLSMDIGVVGLGGDG
eukprot:CAMPEP_0179167132 /NCGR_PEP_ID=MMETSP0796-20121207/82152_1 /TAXON_ID=73915 /ORGANISM="Pyrodinium bahamense, Strain pbaha01" /LENGTH=32 /DNA_ID= /DNA_START= /DNA_END= /DNA_ORIENTATION=